MKKLIGVVVFLCLSPLLVSPALAARPDRLCCDFDSRPARVKERIAWNEKMLYDDLAGIKPDRARTRRNPKLALADEKLSLAMRLCSEALGQVQILKSGVPREIDCGDRLLHGGRRGPGDGHGNCWQRATEPITQGR